MSAIAGLLERGRPSRPGGIAAMTRAMAHRGPDGEGFAEIPAGRGAPLRLGHRDLALRGDARQPLADGAGKAWIVFDGALVNRDELRRDLALRGRTPRSRSDAELALAAYLEWGLDAALERLRGMFAFAVADARSGALRVHLARDRFGVKPLYYAQGAWGFAFASEVRALAAARRFAPDPDAVAALLLFGYVPEPMTTLSGASAFPAGHRASFAPGGKIVPRPYHDYAAVLAGPARRASPSQIPELRRRLARVVAEHLEADAPVGVFLSGGLDSAALAALAARAVPGTPTLSWEYDEEAVSEERWQRLVAARCGTAHRGFRLSRDAFLEGLEGAVAALDLPSMDGANVYFLAREARRAGLKGALTGVSPVMFVSSPYIAAAYPFLAGLARSRSRADRRAFLETEEGRALAPRWKLDHLAEDGPLRLYLLARGQLEPGELRRLLGVEPARVRRLLSRLTDGAMRRAARMLDPLKFLIYMDARFYGLQLIKDSEVMGQRHGLEIRFPYVDHGLAEWMAGVPRSMMLRDGQSKVAFKQAMEDLLPRSVVYRAKQDFLIPHHAALASSGAERLERSLKALGVPAKARAAARADFASGRLSFYKAWALTLAGWVDTGGGPG